MKPPPLDRKTLRLLLEKFDLLTLFIEELGWDHGGTDENIEIDNEIFPLRAVAQKRGFGAYQCVSEGATPPHRTRQKITRSLAKIVHEHLIVFASADHSVHCWQWAKRDRGKTTRYLQHAYSKGQSAEALAQKLERLRFTLDEEDHVSIADASSRVASAFDVEKVTKRFYDRFKAEHQAFLKFISGISDLAGREWYASLMLNRMMFIYFIQKRSFLDGDPDYLRNRLETVAKTNGNGKFHSFYRIFLLRLFHEGLGQPEADRDPGLAHLIGEVPYLNGGLFDVHALESENPNIDIPDDAFKKIFDFFDAYQWHLDDRPLRNDNEINPDVLGFIFEKYVNQKQMGAYYTKEDITGYISRNTILPRLLDQAKEDCAIAFAPKQGIWRLLAEEPDRYIHPSVRHGITLDMFEEGDDRELEEPRSLPLHIANGLNDTAGRDEWNKSAPPEYALPTETWREHIARRQHYDELRRKLVAGEIFSVNDLITYNLDIEQFVEDAINYSEGPELVRAFWKAIRRISILDPTVGSGAFLFAALNVLEPLYNACLSAMRGLLDDLEYSKRSHQREKMSDFRKVLEEIDQHPSDTYFVLKSIVINNLYGVDIMEEAVEICKLRLFLKLVAQLETYEQIEPLPDIDFNIRAGNTLVGFISMDEIKERLGENFLRKQFLPQIIKSAEIAGHAFEEFQDMQAKHDFDASAFSEKKTELNRYFENLRGELDSYLAEDYGVQSYDGDKYRKWRRNYRPFHWLVEFHGIIQRGGFDIIIGNPPYVEQRDVNQYSVKGYKTASCGNLYAFVIERNTYLATRQARTGMILPHSSICTDRMVSFVSILESTGTSVWTSSYDIRPAKLFVGVDQRLMIYLSSGTSQFSKQETTFYSSRFHRWQEDFRLALLEQIKYTCALKSRFNSISKIGHTIEMQILDKIKNYSNIGHTRAKHGKTIYYHNAPRYWIRATDFEPYFWNERDGKKTSTQVKSIEVKNADYRAIVAILNSSLFYWWFLIWSDCRHLNRREIDTFPIGLQTMSDDAKRMLNRLSTQLMENFIQNKERKQATYMKTGKVVYDEFKQSPSKPIVDEIDYVLAPHYGFTDEELDFILNFDIKFRMGKMLML